MYIPYKGLHPPHPLVLLWLVHSRKTQLQEIDKNDKKIKTLKDK